MISYHSHSGSFCCHAVGTLEQVVTTAIEKNFTSYGLSEHVPRYREVDLYPEELEVGLVKISQQFEDYLVEAHRLKSVYSNQLDLVIGLETEYINEEGLLQLEELLSKKGNKVVEYVVGSVHHVDSQPIDFDITKFNSLLHSYPSPSPSSQFVPLFSSYFDAQFIMLQRIKPEVIGHFDLCKIYYPEIDLGLLDKMVWSKVLRNIDYVIEYGGLFEISSAAFRKGWYTAYPSREVFQAIQSRGGKFTLSDDSHGPALVGQHYDRLFDYLESQSLESLYYLTSLARVGDGVKLENEIRRSRGVIIRKIEGKPWLKEWRKLS